MKYIEVAKSLPVGGSTSIPHDGCTTSNKLWVTHERNKYFCYCNKCGYKHRTKKTITVQEYIAMKQQDDKFAASATLPNDFTLNIPAEHMYWLLKYGVGERVQRQYKIGWSPSLNRIILPLYEGDTLKFMQGRAVLYKQLPKYLSSSAVSKGELLFRSESVNSDTVVITEDILSAVVVGQVCDAVSIMGTSISTYQVLEVSKYNKVVVWLDNDKAGIKGRKKILSTLRAMGVTCTYVCTDKDPKEYSKYYIKELLDGLS